LLTLKKKVFFVEVCAGGRFKRRGEKGKIAPGLPAGSLISGTRHKARAFPIKVINHTEGGRRRQRWARRQSDFAFNPA